MTNNIVVTGANKGIGLETVRQLLDLDWNVWLGSRDPERGAAAVEALGREGHAGALRGLTIDVTDDASVSEATALVARELGGDGLDVLVNNAGVAGSLPSAQDTTADALSEVLEVNLLGVARTTRAFLPVLRRATQPRVVNLSSHLGSLSAMSDPAFVAVDYPDLCYPVSKAALNMLTVRWAQLIGDVSFVAVKPGFTATDLNDHADGAGTVERAGAQVVAAVTSPRRSGSFVGPEGPIGW